MIFQVGSWNSTKHFTMFKNLSCNMGNRFQTGTLEGRKLRVVVKEVLKAHSIYSSLIFLILERYDSLYLFFLFFNQYRMTHLLLKRRPKTVLFHSRDIVLICWRNWREIFILPMTSTPPQTVTMAPKPKTGLGMA